MRDSEAEFEVGDKSGGALARDVGLCGSVSELAEALERLNLSAGEFGHREHVQAGWHMVKAVGLQEALELFPKRIRALADHFSAPGLYHQTITWYFLFLIHERLRALPEAHSWIDFERENPDLLVGDGRDLLSKAYLEETLRSEAARRYFVLPNAATATRGKTTDKAPEDGD